MQPSDRQNHPLLFSYDHDDDADDNDDDGDDDDDCDDDDDDDGDDDDNNEDDDDDNKDDDDDDNGCTYLAFAQTRVSSQPARGSHPRSSSSSLL